MHKVVKGVALALGLLAAWGAFTLAYVSRSPAQFVNLSSPPLPNITPQGRLTLTSGTPVMTTDNAGATSIYYTFSTGVLAPIYNGTSVQNYQFTASATDTVGLTIALGSNWAASTLYDVFLTLNSGVVTLCTTPWTSSGAGTSARATALAPYLGFEANNASMTCRYSNSATLTCAQYQCTYVGTFLTNGNAGQVDFKFGTTAANGGIACVCLWNAYNRVPITGMVSDTTSTWTYATSSTWEAAHNSATMRVNAVRGLNTDMMYAEYLALAVPGSGTQAVAGVGLNSTTAFSGRTGYAASAAAGLQVLGSYGGFPGVGLNFASALEYNSTATASTWVGNSGTAYLQTGLSYQATY